MNYIKIDGEEIPFKFTNGSYRRWEKKVGQKLSGIGSDGLSIEGMLWLAYYAIDAGCRLEKKEFPFKTFDAFVDKDEEFDFVNEIMGVHSAEEKKGEPS